MQYNDLCAGGRGLFATTHTPHSWSSTTPHVHVPPGLDPEAPIQGLQLVFSLLVV